MSQSLEMIDVVNYRYTGYNIQAKSFPQAQDPRFDKWSTVFC